MARRSWWPWDDREGQDARREPSGAEDRVPGVLDALQAGYDTLNDRLYLIAVPLALDLVLWLGPRLTAPALFDWLARLPARSADGTDLARALHDRGQTAEIMAGIGRVWNVYGVSNLVGLLGRGHVASAIDRPTAVVGPWYVTILVLLALLLIGLWLKALFVAPIAQTVRQEPLAFGWTMRAGLRAATRMLALYLAAGGMILLTLIPVALFAVASALAGLNAFLLVLLAALVPVLWTLFYGSFAVDAIFLEEVGPMRAAYLSYRVVRRNVWPTAAFIALTLIISRGVPLALTRVVQQPVGVFLAIIAHAYVAAGLAAGSLIFYRERRARVRDVRPEGALESAPAGQEAPEGQG